MTNVMPHDKKVEVIEISTGMFKAYLHANHVPFTIESEGVQRTEYQCDTVLTAPMSFASEESATEFFTEHHTELVDAILAREAVGRAKSEAEIAQAYLDSTDYMVVKCAELGLSMLDRYPDEFERREDSRRIIREYRRMVS
ncbi:MAG: hypothetical protein RBT66_07460 [bacterium]|nr:hypothetical protein [bacterium]